MKKPLIKAIFGLFTSLLLSSCASTSSRPLAKNNDSFFVERPKAVALAKSRNDVSTHVSNHQEIKQPSSIKIEEEEMADSIEPAPIVIQTPSLEITAGDTPNDEAPITNFVFTHNLGYGSTGRDVILLQDRLAGEGFPVVMGNAPKGQFGIRTKLSVALFQKRAGIPATGFVGPITRAYFNGHSVRAGKSIEDNQQTNEGSLSPKVSWYLSPAQKMAAQSSFSNHTLDEVRRMMQVIHCRRFISPEAWIPSIPDQYVRAVANPEPIRFQGQTIYRGNCLGKTLCLFSKLAGEAEFVYGEHISKAKIRGLNVDILGPDKKTWHCWLRWQYQGRSYILDPSLNDVPTLVLEDETGTRYIPHYIADKSGVRVVGGRGRNVNLPQKKAPVTTRFRIASLR